MKQGAQNGQGVVVAGVHFIQDPPHGSRMGTDRGVKQNKLRGGSRDMKRTKRNYSGAGFAFTLNSFLIRLEKRIDWGTDPYCWNLLLHFLN